MPINSFGADKYKQPLYGCIHRQIHLIDGLKANMLVKNNINGPKSIMIDLANSTAFIINYNIWIAITDRQKGQPLKEKLMADTIVFLPPNFQSLIPVLHGTLLSNRDFFF